MEILFVISSKDEIAPGVWNWNSTPSLSANGRARAESNGDGVKNDNCLQSPDYRIRGNRFFPAGNVEYDVYRK
jgi:hypothetical protein